MRIGFAGAHRTGKTTTARAIARIATSPFVETQTTALAHKLGFDMNAADDFGARIDFQVAVLRMLTESYEAAGPKFVSDRTPLDAAAYLLAEVQAKTGNAVTQDLVLQYVDQAVALTKRFFDVVILVPPAIAVEPVDGKPLVNAAFQEHHHLIVRGLAWGSRLEGVRVGEIQRENTNRIDRISAVCNFVWGDSVPLAQAAA